MSKADLHSKTIPGAFIENMALGVINRSDLDSSIRTQVLSLGAQQRVAVIDYVDLVEAIQQQYNDEMVGLTPTAMPLGSFNTLCNLLKFCPSLSDAIENYLSFTNLFSNNAKPLLTSQPFENLLRIQIADNSSNTSTVLDAHFAMAIHMLLGLYKTLCWLTSHRLSLASLQFPLSASVFTKEITYLFGQQPEFANTSPFIEFELSVLNRPISPSTELGPHARLYMPYLLVWLVEDSLEQVVYATLAQNVDLTIVSLDNLASQLQLGSHTLARRLRARNTSYKEIFESVRKDRAILLLKDSRPLSIEQIALRVGYSDASTFSRAFKSWTGLSPANFKLNYSL